MSFSTAEAELLRENRALRRMLWAARNDGTGYCDDGELQYQGVDFLCDPVEFIESSIQKWAAERLALALKQDPQLFEHAATDGLRGLNWPECPNCANELHLGLCKRKKPTR